MVHVLISVENHVQGNVKEQVQDKATVVAVVAVAAVHVR